MLHWSLGVNASPARMWRSWKLCFPTYGPPLSGINLNLGWSSKGCKRSFCGLSNFVLVIPQSRVLAFQQLERGGIFSAQSIKSIDCWERLSVLEISCLGDAEKKAHVRESGGFFRAAFNPLLSSGVSSNFLRPACILNLLKQFLKSCFLVTCCSYHIRPDWALEKAGKPEVSWPILYNVTSATGSWSHAVDGRREMGQYMYTFVPVSYSPAGDSWKFSWLVHYPGGEKELIFTRLCTGELLSWLLLIIGVFVNPLVNEDRSCFTLKIHEECISIRNNNS